MLQRLLLATIFLSAIFAQPPYTFEQITINDLPDWALDMTGSAGETIFLVNGDDELRIRTYILAFLPLEYSLFPASVIFQ